MVVGGALLVHVAALWALQAGLIRRPAEVVIPVEILSRLVEPPPDPAPATLPAAAGATTATRAAPGAHAAGSQAPPARTGTGANAATGGDPQAGAPGAKRARERGRGPAASARAADRSAGTAHPATRTGASASAIGGAPAGGSDRGAGAVRGAAATGLSGPQQAPRTKSARSWSRSTTTATAIPQRAEIAQSSGFDRLDRAAREAALTSRVTPFRQAGATDDTVYLLKAPFNFVLN